MKDHLQAKPHPHKDHYLSDVEIPLEKIELFIKEHKLTFDKISQEYLKKITQLKNNTYLMCYRFL